MRFPYSIVIACFVSTLAIAQEKCETPEETINDLNSISITKCSIEDVKKALEDDKDTKVTVVKRQRVVRNNTMKSTSKVKQIKSNALLVQKLNLKEDKVSALKKIPFHLVEEIPLFKKCENSPLLEQSKCFEEQMVKHITRNFNYPQEAIENRIEGKVMVQFTINKEGEVTDIKKRGPVNGALLEKEAVRLVNKLPSFVAGKHKGTYVNVKYSFPIIFKLPKENKEEVEGALAKTTNVNTSNSTYASEIPFHLVEKIPLFSKCANNTLTDKSSCFEQEMINHVSSNFRYPKEAQQRGIEGKVLVKFTIDENGKVANVTKKGPVNGELLEEEAERLIKSLPTFVPGVHNGKTVRVKYALPIIFRNPKRN